MEPWKACRVKDGHKEGWAEAFDRLRFAGLAEAKPCSSKAVA